MSLKDLAIGQQATVCGFEGDAHLIGLLREIGFHEDADVENLGKGPFGAPLQIRLGRSVIALRPEEADAVKVVPVL